MKFTSMRATLLGAALSAIAPISHAAYTFTTIHYPGAVSTRVWGLNNTGKVVGGTTIDPLTGAGNGFVYDIATASYSVLPLTAGGLTVHPLGINDAGDICGSSYDPASTVSTGQIYSLGAYVAFGYPGRINTNCRAINNAGTVTGYAETGGTDAVGFIYNGAGFTTIDFPGSVFQITQGINAAGTVVGSVIQPSGAVYAGSPAGNYAWVRSSTGVVTTFRINGVQTRARGINDGNKVAGWITVPGTGQRGFVIDAPSGGGHVDIAIDPADLIQVPGAANTIVEGINNRGDLSGIWDSGAGTEFRGFVATVPVAELLEDLGDLITGMGLPRGTERSLMAKVEAAQRSYARGNVSAACGQLQALINQASAQSGKSLTVAQANAIIAAATEIRTALGC
jgi:hypothetical protein